MSNVYLINGVEVTTRMLPSGDMVVWHPAGSVVRSVVESICRGRGYWDPKYRNWIVKGGCVASALMELEMTQLKSG